MATAWYVLGWSLFMLTLAGAVVVRKNVETLSSEDILNLQKALRDVNSDTTAKGYAAIAAYHGYPASCKDHGHDVACCVHGSPVFPQWHRTYVVQLEQALQEKGLAIGIPYWDWTEPLTHLPNLVNQKVFLDTAGGRARENIWYSGDIPIGGKIVKTARAVDRRLFQKVGTGEETNLFKQVLNALEYDDYCQFEVEYEVAHNTIHYLVGGRNKYSMSHLEYTSYDPLFFLHHSNVDRIYAIYVALQKAKGTWGKSEKCDVKAFNSYLEPFGRDSNPYPVTKVLPKNSGDESVFGYRYDNLTLNGHSLTEIAALLNEKKNHDRAFATFRLHGIGSSANVRVKVCVPAVDKRARSQCTKAGDFFILGGPTEMPWSFRRPYYYEVTDTVLKLGLKLTDKYFIKADLFSVNGTQLSSDILPNPFVSFRPAEGTIDPNFHSTRDVHADVSVRKDIERLTPEEAFQLRDALRKFQSDKSIDGYQATAEFHGEPGKCPFPTAKNRNACCIHGAPTFAHWHRLIVVQVEDALRRRGANIGIPYWDWTKPNTHIPALAAEETYKDPNTGETIPNPFYQADIAYLRNKTVTHRKPLTGLSQSPKWGDHTELFDAVIGALAETDFCDFEVQFEVAHNLIHALVGGSDPYGLATLSYSAFDPIFYIHHSNIDKIWAIWTALQQKRGLPYKAHCAQSYTYKPLKPFAFSSPYNNNEKTFSHATPRNIYDYEKELRYAYDNLEFGGFNIEELDNYINANYRSKDRTYVGVVVWGIGKSAVAHVYLKPANADRFEAGRFAILGGPTEMPWRFDRPYKFDITDALSNLGLAYNDNFEVIVEIHDIKGTAITNPFPVTIVHKPKKDARPDHSSLLHTRKNVDQLNEAEVLELRHALSNLQQDSSPGAFQDLGRYHGTPKWCPSPDAEVKKSCCVHGMPTFLHWHRVWTVQAENALRRHGLHGAIPYWDWTKPNKQLPALVRDAKYTDPSNQQEVDNPFFKGHIVDVDADTTRSVREDLYEQPAFGEYTAIARQVLLALEQDSFCDFGVQFEIAHNFIHALVGGNEPHSMASLMFTAFDPLFYLHHSNTDRIWAIWQALQKYRGKPYNNANCAIGQLRKPLSPFGLTSDVNPDPVTRENSIPFKAFDYAGNFHYEYDNLEFNGLNIPQLARVLEQRKSEDRVFVGFLLHGIGQSSLVKFYVVLNEGPKLLGEFYILGDTNEMDWAYNRLYKFEITLQLKTLGLHYNDRLSITYEVYNLAGTVISTNTFGTPTVLHELGTSHLYGKEYRETASVASQIRRNLNSLNVGEVESLRAAFLTIQDKKIYEKIASFHGRPGLCQFEGRTVACCVHGSPTFPPWHRLYVEAVEEALLGAGSNVAVPYWDWTLPISKLPELINEATYFNSRTQKFEPNPFFSGSIAGENAVTTRDPQPLLFNNEHLYEEALFALEQNNFCDFEIQFEVLHNALHSYLGGRAVYSMASLDYTAFDPVFFLHHSNTDRLWAIWQELQRYRGLPYNEADCAINLMRTPLKPFSDAKNSNPDALTLKYSRPVDTFDYRNHFHYEYDNLEFNGMSIPQLNNLLKRRQENGRVFAGFLLHHIGLSADVEIYVCVPTGISGERSCNHKAGQFSVLGGELEMPFVFDRLYKQEITPAIRGLGLKLNNAAAFELAIDIIAHNGSHLSSDLLDSPSIIFVPGTKDRQEPDGRISTYAVRKEINSLSPRERISLINALKSFQADTSADGFQSVASFHALPPLCPSPAASHRYACCIHGMATFPPWHRVYTVQVENALKRHGSLVGIPYWDWTRELSALPSFLTDVTYQDPYTGVTYDNPFNKARIEFKNVNVERDVLGDYLFRRGPHGWDTWLFEQVLYALEQEDYCDFEVQLEIAHNAIHSWVGGSKVNSMAHLHYASYDPAFFIHHSNTDRIWALWQALQKFRGHHPNEVNCALELMREPLKPFSFGSPYNLNPDTKAYSKPEDTFDYEGHFHYRYDDLDFIGLNVPDLDSFIKERQTKDRVFAGFLLKGFGSSALVNFDICAKGTCFEAGYFTVLGGSAEMPWHFDRLFKYEITNQLKSHNLRFDDAYDFKVHVKAINGSEILNHPIPVRSVLYEPGRTTHDIKSVPENHIRHNLNSLTERDIQSLKSALRDLQQDNSSDGWAALGSFHGAPARCPDPANPSVACCQHGMPTFPPWHRLFTVQIEQALRRHGSSIALPYWDWTDPFTELPSLFTQPSFYDPWKDEVFANPFAHGYVPSENAYTVRDVQPELYQTTSDGSHSTLIYLVLSALEQTDYCDFEVQFEVAHNAIHYLVGGHQTYSLSSLEYSAYDPIFFIHHSFVDKVWAVWQELQKRRHLPYDRADCAVNFMSEPMKPFSLESLNLNKFTRDHAVPNTLFHYEDLDYVYDDLTIGNYTLDQIEAKIAYKQSKPRVFAAFLLKGIKTSGYVELQVCKRNGQCTFAGRFNLLGGPTEASWAFDRTFDYDITWALKIAGLTPESVFDLEIPFTLDTKVFDVEGHAKSLKSVMPPPTLIFVPARGATGDVASYAVAGVGVRKDVSTLSEAEIENIRSALRKVAADSGPNGFQNIASFHGEPANRCKHNGRAVACCVHGAANFPQWHRLYVKQWEDALTAQGARIGIPYWDWTTAFTALPSLVTQEGNNPFHHGKIYNGKLTTRVPRDQLFNDPEFGTESFFYRQVLLAFEQTDYCDFEIQFEITHNAIHSWTGGSSPYGMSSLEYTAYDPLFLLHHSNVDRQFAIWQALQKYRGLPYDSANCDIQLLHQPMRPFSDDDNINPVTRRNSRAIDAFHYDRLNYQYDNLNFHGLTIPELNKILEKRKEETRIFAEFLLHNIGTSADITFKVCDAKNHCEFAGTFAVLGGPTEMPWSSDRLFKYDVTKTFKALNLRTDDVYHFKVEVKPVTGENLTEEAIGHVRVQLVEGVKRYYEQAAAEAVVEKESLIRKDVNHLTLAEAAELRNALNHLQQEQGPSGYEALAGFHGYPFRCPETGTDKYACCVHGMAVFPHWHRIFTVQFEQALKAHGSHIGIPYWDWTSPVRSLPSLFGDSSNYNPFYSYTIKSIGKTTTRNVQSELFNPYTIEGHNHIYHLALDTLEEDNFCDFEVQYEVLHNEIHALIGGNGTYSMTTLDYSAFDPFFIIHHSSIDRIWIIWQELQKLRRKPFNYAKCAGHLMEEPLHPFNYPEVNKNDFTRLNAIPNVVFDHTRFGYEYDKLELNGHPVEEINSIITERHRHSRIYLAGVATGIGDSIFSQFSIVKDDGVLVSAGKTFLLGSNKEVPWAYERLFRFDITNVLAKAGVDPHSLIKFNTIVKKYTGEVVTEINDYSIIVERPAYTDYDVVVIPIGKILPLPAKIVVKKGTRVKFVPVTSDYNNPVENLGSYTTLHRCTIPPFTYNSYQLNVVHPLKPGDYFFTPKSQEQCQKGLKFQLTVEDE